MKQAIGQGWLFMRKIGLIVFSGTGNTWKCGQMLQEALEEKGALVILKDLDQPVLDWEWINDLDLVGIGYPIHAFNVPKLLYERLKTLPALPKKYFIFKTSGEPFAVNRSSSYALYRKLKKKGWELQGELHTLMPYNIMFRYPDALARQMHDASRVLCRVFAEQWSKGQLALPKYPVAFRVLSVVFRIQWSAAGWNGRIYRVKEEQCSKCRACVQNCPSQNIVWKDDRPAFQGNCTMCMRCAMNCPKSAISIGLLSRWKVNPAYDWNGILKGEYTPYISKQTRGYFKWFYPFFQKVDELAEEYGIESKRLEETNTPEECDLKQYRQGADKKSRRNSAM